MRMGSTVSYILFRDMESGHTLFSMVTLVLSIISAKDGWQDEKERLNTGKSLAHRNVHASPGARIGTYE